MSLVPGYGSSSESGGDAAAPAAGAPPPEERAAKRSRPAPPTYTGNFFEGGGGGASSSEDASDDDDGEEERQAAQAAPVLRPSGLPSATELFSAVTGPPAFLRPEATRAIAVLEAHPHASAPPLHPALGGGSDRRADAAVIASAPTRYSAEEAAKRAALSALRREAEVAEVAEAAEAAAQAPASAAPRRDFRSKAVAVSEVMANPQLNLPRDKQERKDRERAKRERGQSAIGSWKSEAEMVLRQQYDS